MTDTRKSKIWMHPLFALALLVAMFAGCNIAQVTTQEVTKTQVYFGDTHHHNANSGDAFMNGDRFSPEQAYRFARGEEVVSSSGVPVALERPLDFLVISDHAEGLGACTRFTTGTSPMATCLR